MARNTPSSRGCSDGGYHFVLYVDSAKPKSLFIADKLRQLCQEHLVDLYHFDVVDLRDDPSLFEQRRIIAAPTLDVITPENRHHRFVGDLSHSEPFIIAIGMAQEADKMGHQARKMGHDAVRVRTKLKRPG